MFCLVGTIVEFASHAENRMFESHPWQIEVNNPMLDNRRASFTAIQWLEVMKSSIRELSHIVHVAEDGALTERWRSAGDRGCSSHRHWRGQGDELSGLMNGQILSQDLSQVKTELFEHIQKKLTCTYKQTDKATWPPKILSMLFTVSAYPLIALHKADDYPYRVHVL